jgi:hypothetical protein
MTKLKTWTVRVSAGVGGVGCLAMAYFVPIPMSAASAPAATPPAQTASAAPAAVSEQRTLVNRYCVTCHNEKLKTANLLLDKADLDHVGASAAVWEKVVRKLRANMMPPPGMPRPDAARRDEFVSWLEDSLDAAAAAAPNPGRPAVHRLNRAEYTNAIRDLLAVEVDARALLPIDDSSYGFDNIADVLSVSPGLLERYMLAAQKISRMAVGDPATRPASDTYKVSSYLSQDQRMNEELPFGSRGGIAVRHHFPIDGEYVVRVRLLRDHNVDIIGLVHPNQIEVRVDGAKITEFTVGGKYPVPVLNRITGKQDGAAPDQRDYDKNADDDLEVRFSVKAGPRVVGVAFIKTRAALTEGVDPSRWPIRSASGQDKYTVNPGIASIRIAGPYNGTGVGDTPSRQRIFSCHPTGKQDEMACATKVLSALGRRAFRRPLTDKDVQTLLGLYQAGHQSGTFEDGIELALRGILVDPDFLFRVEHDPANVAPGSVYRLSDLELASRLSFFLWSSIPDDELLALAARGKLKEPGVLEQQVRRMLADKRSKELVNNFAGQWLQLRNMRVVVPDPKVFPEFDDTLREAMLTETELFFESQLREDRSVVDLLTADYTFVNERLARHYGIPNVYGSHFRRVDLDENSVAGGLLGQASILTVTSYAERTSPTRRGKWLLENVLGTPPPPPPPDIPDLPDAGKDDKHMTMRQRMEQHRTNPVCASCHRTMDPMGFAMENFDAIGRWRTSDGSSEIDSSGTLPDGTKLSGPNELRKLLPSQREAFAGTVTEKLLIYALGRGIEPYDMPAVRQIMREAAGHDYTWSSVILGIARSMPFQKRLSPSAPIRTAEGKSER